MRLATVLVLCVLVALTALTVLAQVPTTAKVYETTRSSVSFPPKKVDAREVDLADYKLDFNKESTLTEPLKLTSAGDLKLSPLAALGSNLKADFKTEYVLLFQWQGSGKDALTPAAVTKDGKTTVTFTRKPGATDDVRQHSKAFVLPAGTEWKVVAK